MRSQCVVRNLADDGTSYTGSLSDSPDIILKNNRDASNVFASLYWSPPATLVSPNLWTLVGYAYFPDVPMGSVVEVSIPGITWPSDQLPGMGHDCFAPLLEMLSLLAQIPLASRPSMTSRTTSTRTTTSLAQLQCGHHRLWPGAVG